MTPNPDNKDHLRALLAAYNEVTGFELTFIAAREKWLRALDKLELTPEDVRAVMRELKRLVESDPKRYPESCLDFRNAMMDTEKFDGRARRLRARAKRKKQGAAASGGGVEERRAAVPSDQEAAIRAQAKRGLGEFLKQMGGRE
jgi:hypothetical protein